MHDTTIPIRYIGEVITVADLVARLRIAHNTNQVRPGREARHIPLRLRTRCEQSLHRQRGRKPVCRTDPDGDDDVSSTAARGAAIPDRCGACALGRASCALPHTYHLNGYLAKASTS